MSAAGTIHSKLALGAQVLLALAFIAAGALKIADPAAFARDIWRFRLLPAEACAALALYLPWLEIAVGGALVTRRGEGAARWLAAAMLGVFSAALLSAWARGIDVRCGCFGEAAAMSAGMALARNAALAVLLALAWRKR